VASGDQALSHFDKMSQMSRKLFEEKLQTYPDWKKGYSLLAAFVLKRGNNASL
jgi:hypothetical protein